MNLIFICVICEICELTILALMLDKQTLFRIMANGIRHRSFADGNTLFRLAWLSTETGYNDYNRTGIDLAGDKT
ncbi:MAG TPA: hypothetical protein PLN17_07115 [Candidatus Cloacimonas sp.]|nr:hypothetical protein [Candidatus Cloacimonas sp.]